MSERIYPIPTTVQLNFVSGTGSGPHELVPAVPGMIGLVWGMEQVLGSASTQTVRSGSNIIDAAPTSATRTWPMPVGDPIRDCAFPVHQGVNPNEAITIQLSTAATYSFKVRYSYVEP